MIIKNARLVPFLTEGYEGEYADVYTEENEISDLRPAGTCEYFDVDARGMTLLPGLMDLHMHFYFSTGDFYALAAENHNQHFVDAIAYAKFFLDSGYTVIRDCGNPDGIGVAVRDAIASGIIEGPRVFTAGKCITPTAKGNDTFPSLYDEVDDPAAVMGICRKEYSDGIDFLKYMATGSVANRTGVPGALITTREELFAMQAAADSLGTYVGVHCHGTEGIKFCIEAGIRTIEHASFMTDECIRMILERGNQTALIPTLSPVCQLYEDTNSPKWLRDKIPAIWDAAKMLVKAERSGVRLGWGTDQSMATYKKDIGYEFHARKQAGFTEEEMLKQATINSAEIMGIADRYGTVKPGKNADLILISGNPDKDISVMSERPALVMKDGKIVRNRL